MELFVFRHTEWARLYNCSVPDLQVDLVPLERRRQFRLEAWLTGGLCMLYYVLYAPCLLSIWRHRRDNACYKLLFYIGVMDLSILWLLGFVHAWLSLEGAVFCSRPVITYWAGMGVTSIWMAESSADMVLALNRCLEILWPKFADSLFHGWRILLWISVCSIYALYWLMFQTPAIFSSTIFGYFFNPFVGYREDTAGLFYHPIYPVHNFTIAFGLPLFYTLFAVALVFKSRSLGGQFRFTRAQKMSFLQVFLISSMNATASSIYVVMAYIVYRPWMMRLTHFTWIHIHGFPPVIFLALNKTIRNDCWTMLVKLFCPDRVHRRVNVLKDGVIQPGALTAHFRTESGRTGPGEE